MQTIGPVSSHFLSEQIFQNFFRSGSRRAFQNPIKNFRPHVPCEQSLLFWSSFCCHHLLRRIVYRRSLLFCISNFNKMSFITSQSTAIVNEKVRNLIFLPPTNKSIASLFPHWLTLLAFSYLTTLNGFVVFRDKCLK